MKTNLLLKFRIFIFIFLQFCIFRGISQEISNIELEGIYRIDSLYNNYSLAIQEDKIFLTEEKYGNNLLFFITPTFLNSYFIISWEQNKRLGIDDDHNLHLYNIEDKENIERTYWNITRYDNNTNIFLIENIFSQTNLESGNSSNKKDKIYSSRNVDKFSFLKLFEEVHIRPIDFEMLSKEPIDF